MRLSGQHTLRILIIVEMYNLDWRTTNTRILWYLLRVGRTSDVGDSQNSTDSEMHCAI